MTTQACAVIFLILTNGSTGTNDRQQEVDWTATLLCRKECSLLGIATRNYAMTKLSFEETLIEVWRQALVENAKTVKVGGESYPVRLTPKRGLRQVDFVLDGNEIRGLEQNADTKSRWAQLARSGKKVMQFLNEGHYAANVVDV